ncbi:uncharacterized protein LOC126374016 [Pectinophora gossypiella]|uniref:uncharacterized protein LOC126374016 n=1 Tax=Pectinophora gossypiella TaxID=13191 RepID=UPI00214EF16E|nr:uncharacterized protein LOC126374016 [Pectinophora gossypiella]
MHRENGQVERYCRTVLNMLRVEVGNRGVQWSDVLWRVQLTLNITRQSTTQASPLQLLIGIDAATPAIRSLVRDTALHDSGTNREALMTLRRQRAAENLTANQRRQDAYVNEDRRQPRVYSVGDFVFVSKSSQSTGKLDAGMRGPYKVVSALPHHRYELELLAGSYGKRTQAAAENMVLWHGEWTPETCAAFFRSDDHDEPGDGPNDDGSGDDDDTQPAAMHAGEDAPRSGTAVLASPCSPQPSCSRDA